ncbi:alpha/beta hydrolase family protein [Saccharibacillus kuerlensis]|uniref:Serine aminopeptidase S33 domain-containing protein n=1 Tax=Saccharibacillus kuerlensis TaxID=459527 RepID=A0ABQ2LAE8_9BACL|nr:alpha/beta fold hydrolase [Saccharibacillus kuerlensis]GGO08318.1 hypothetical protein GCM10010969_37660 [Saccharibacillus kuerlensis]
MYKKMLVSLSAVLAFTAAGAVVAPNESARTASAAVQEGESTHETISGNTGSSLLVEGDIAFEYPGSNGVTLRGSVRLPDSYQEGQTYPVVILSHGVFGDRNQQGMFTSMTDALKQKGFVTVRFDFNGYGESGGTLINNSIKSEKEDLHAIIDYVKTLSYVDQSRINLVGYSMGGAATSLVAGERPNDIHSIALWAPAAILVDDAERGDFFGTKVDVNNLPDEVSVFGGMFTFGKKWFEDAIGLDIYGIASQYTGSAFIVHGEKDAVVPMSYSERYQEVYSKNTKLVSVKDGEHVLSGKPLEQAIKRTVNFLNNQNNRQN